MFTPQPQHGRCTNEEVFFEHYAQLLEWALQLTQMDRADAEDLIQDLYIQIAGIGVSLAEVEETRPYLFKILRNLHYSRLRQRGKNPITDLTALDYESLEKGLVAVDLRGLFLIRANLKHICEFACERKQSTRAASIFILRYFLGYYPSEVMKVAQTSRIGVDKLLHFMRREAQLHLDRRDGLRAPSRKNHKSPSTHKQTDTTHALFLELREIITTSCEGNCFPPEGLDQYYRDDSPVRLSVEALAHLVSCKSCLDGVNVLLGLPLLDERSPDDTIGRDNSSGSGDFSGPRLSLRKAKQKPDASARKVLARGRSAWFEHRPLRLEIAINGEPRTWQRITAEISEFHLKLNRTEPPEFIEIFSEQGVRLSYLHALDPSLCPALEQRQIVELSDDRTLTVQLSHASDGPTVHVVYLDSVLAHASIEKEEAGVEPGNVVTIPARNQRRFMERLASWLRISRMHPLLATSVALAFTSILCLEVWLHQRPKVSAEDLLTRAQAQDASAERRASAMVIYQKVRISGSGNAMERAIYHDPQKKRRAKPQQLTPGDQWLKDKVTLANVNWEEPLSAASYRDWHDHLLAKQDVVTRAGNLLTLTTSTDTNSPVAKESLTVRESDFHAVDRTIELRNGGTVEIAELAYDVMPWGPLNQDQFEPLAAVANAPALHAALHVSHVLSDHELDEAELTARTVLNQLHADAGEPIEVTRSVSGINITGVVNTNERKRELLAHLSSVPHLHAAIRSAGEITQHSPAPAASGNTEPIQVVAVEARPSPLENYLRENNLPLEQRATVSHNLLYGGLKVIQAAVHLSELQPQLKNADHLSSDLQNQLAALSRAHIDTIRAGLDANQRTLSSIKLDGSDQTTTVTESADPARDIGEQTQNYQRLCLELISSDTGQPRRATTIATEIQNTARRIRLDLAAMSASLTRYSN